MDGKWGLMGAIRRFLEARRVDRGASPATLEAYSRDLLQFTLGLPEDRRYLNRIQTQQLEEFLKVQDLKATSLARKTSSLKQFFKFCCAELELHQNPAEDLESPRPDRGLPKSLTTAEVEQLLEAVNKGLNYQKEPDLLRARDRALVFLLYATGLRVSELLGLRPGSLDVETGFVRVCGKGDKERVVPFAPVAGEYVLAYLKLLNERKIDSPYLFVNRAGARLSRQGFWKLLKKFGLQAGVTKRLSPHVLRHSFATHLLQSGLNLRSLQMLLGHSDLTTTQIYTAVSPVHLKKAHQKFHPRG